MKLRLYNRHYGKHDLIKECEVDLNFTDVYLGEDNINEELLLSIIPEDFLLSNPIKTLISIETEWGSTGQRKLKHFRDWAKYFDAYNLELGR